jgi:hypothetical protein
MKDKDVVSYLQKNLTTATPEFWKNLQNISLPAAPARTVRKQHHRIRYTVTAAIICAVCILVLNLKGSDMLSWGGSGRPKQELTVQVTSKSREFTSQLDRENKASSSAEVPLLLWNGYIYALQENDILETKNLGRILGSIDNFPAYAVQSADKKNWIALKKGSMIVGYQKIMDTAIMFNGNKYVIQSVQPADASEKGKLLGTYDGVKLYASHHQGKILADINSKYPHQVSQKGFYTAVLQK